MVRETGIQSQVDSYQTLKNGTWCCLAEHSANFTFTLLYTDNTHQMALKIIIEKA